ncbi:glycine--tRNA ligase subunit beta [Escherichia coli]
MGGIGSRHHSGIDSARTIRGHRFMGEPEFTIDNASQYPQILLERGMVVADFMARKAKIKGLTPKRLLPPSVAYSRSGTTPCWKRSPHWSSGRWC